MAVCAVVGAQWGDEGKGRVVDYLAQRADLVIRFQGGDNAGHTVVNDYGKFFLHMVPSGIFNPNTQCIVGAGTVVNPENLLEELRIIEEAGVDTGNLLLEARAHIVFPFHRQLDGLQEAARSGKAIGTTKRGIGPAYADKAARHGVRLGDLKHPEHFRPRLSALVELKNRHMAFFGEPPLDFDALYTQAMGWAEQIGHRIVDTLPLVQQAVRGGQQVLLEGQLGVMRDLDWGTYPYVTSSNPMVGAACAGAGMPPTAIDEVVGVVKAYSTSVGAGPFPCELFDADGEQLRTVGDEFGATTGRPRRCGWFDAVSVQHSAWLNGFTALALTKLDVLDGFDEIKVCVGYMHNGVTLDYVPDTPVYEEVTPVYETLPGWKTPTRDARTWAELPEAAQNYLRRLEALAGVPIKYISVGPARDELITLAVAGTENA
ncbi:MAG: adenylosuccinate synthase [Bradymonadia bacterium]